MSYLRGRIGEDGASFIFETSLAIHGLAKNSGVTQWALAVTAICGRGFGRRCEVYGTEIIKPQKPGKKLGGQQQVNMIAAAFEKIACPAQALFKMAGACFNGAAPAER